MDDDDGEGAQRSRRNRSPKVKYMQMLQEVANRTRNSVLIELDDLDEVRKLSQMPLAAFLTASAV